MGIARIWNSDDKGSICNILAIYILLLVQHPFNYSLEKEIIGYTQQYLNNKTTIEETTVCWKIQ